MTTPRIDSLQPGETVILKFPLGPEQATVILPPDTSLGEARTATFSTRDPETGEPNIWEAYRQQKRWCYGSGGTPLKVLGRALPPPEPFPAADPRSDAAEAAMRVIEAVTGAQVEAWSVDFAGQTDSDGEPWDAPADPERIAAATDRPLQTPNSTCLCGNPATVPTGTQNLSVCEECAAREEGGTE